MPTPLSRERIVQAAINLADEDGLSAVSLRKVAAELNVGPMRLYGYIDTKEELLELMLDAVYAEIRPSGETWRETLRSLAEGIRQAAHQHEWFADLIGGRPQLGPNTLTSGEAVVAGLSGMSVDIIVPVMAAVNAYVIGAVRREITERRAERSTGTDMKQFQAAYGPYLRRMLATGRFPSLSTLIHDGPHLTPDETFHTGLDYLLDGIEARLSS
ncbi:TetR/AcrR family transcriptional regulator [Actinomadura barringtoniae]|uniref:TetR/AcrR family transcriptional regulator n=1 Tax=Actinomadura barringtoniae TaxID=1427535 RepID=UPI0027DBA00B|nr:TetR/AcrR family transcriptional regulator [Actinomadura barringtoniae]